MKPSEFVRYNLHTPLFTSKDFLKHIKYYDKKLIDLDKKFIDKEKLKKKIKKLNLYSYDEERILKLLEE